MLHFVEMFVTDVGVEKNGSSSDLRLQSRSRTELSSPELLRSG